MSYIKDLEPRLKNLLVTKKFSVDDQDLLYKYSELIFYRHFNQYKSSKSDLIQEGVFGAVQIIQTGSYNPEMSASNYVFTRMRNSMTNFLYKIKETLIEDDFILDMLVCNTTMKATSRVDVSSMVIMFIDNLCASDELKKVLKIRFLSDLDVDLDVQPTYKVSNQEYSFYNYYINFIEYMIMEEVGKSIFENDIKDIVAVLGKEDPTFCITAKTLPAGFLEKLLLVFSGVTVKVPSRNKLKAIDTSLSIYLEHRDQNLTVEELCYKYDKTDMQVHKILSEYENMNL